MNVLSAIKVSCVGFAGGVILRTVQLLFFFDFEMGYYKDGGELFPWITVGFIALCSALAMLMCAKDTVSFGESRGKSIDGYRSISVCVAAIISAIGISLSSVLQYTGNERLVKDSGADVIESQSRIFTVFFALCIAFAVLQLLVGIGFLTGRHIQVRLSLLYSVAVIWSIMNVLMIYVFYSKSANMVENVFPVAGSVLIMLCLLYICKLFALGAHESTLKRICLFGLPAMMVTFSYAIGNYIALFFEGVPKSVVPFSIMLSPISVALFIVAMVLSIRRISQAQRSGEPYAADTLTTASPSAGVITGYSDSENSD